MPIALAFGEESASPDYVAPGLVTHRFSRPAKRPGGSGAQTQGVKPTVALGGDTDPSAQWSGSDW